MITRAEFKIRLFYQSMLNPGGKLFTPFVLLVLKAPLVTTEVFKIPHKLRLEFLLKPSAVSDLDIKQSTSRDLYNRIISEDFKRAIIDSKR